MRKGSLIAVGAFGLALCALEATVAASPGRPTSDLRAAPSAARCGGNLWRLKTFSDRDRNVVDLNPRPATIGAIAQRRAPHPIPTRRTTPFQRQIWTVPAQITRYWREGNELRLQLYDHNVYMNAVVPAPSCLPKTTRARAAIVATWDAFDAHCGHATRLPQPSGAVVTLSGVGYWSDRHSRHGEAPNGAELHPVTGLRAVAGCGN